MQRNKTPEKMLSLCEINDYLKIALYSNVSYEKTYSQLVIWDCLSILLGELMEKRSVDPDDLIKALHNDEGVQLEAFLKEAIVK